eukprot:comp21358_c0_seq1/m.29324 comp21358_c0_seq1/g.29324  ORF comp21358_c0_seq1/g.29324 comp21358_c0_seq1/m.29324 type:complete len:711 (-) comp21358_c0_seq1:557-2689(-)
MSALDETETNRPASLNASEESPLCESCSHELMDQIDGQSSGDGSEETSTTDVNNHDKALHHHKTWNCTCNSISGHHVREKAKKNLKSATTSVQNLISSASVNVRSKVWVAKDKEKKDSTQEQGAPASSTPDMPRPSTPVDGRVVPNALNVGEEAGAQRRISSPNTAKSGKLAAPLAAGHSLSSASVDSRGIRKSASVTSLIDLVNTKSELLAQEKNPPSKTLRKAVSVGSQLSSRQTWTTKLPPGKNYGILLRVVSARQLPEFQVEFEPRTFVKIHMDETKRRTAPKGCLDLFGNQDHSNPRWEETVLLPLNPSSTDDVISLKVYTTLSAKEGISEYVVGKAKIPVAAIPILDAMPSEEDINGVATQPDSFLLLTDEKGDCVDTTALSRLELLGPQPVKISVRLNKPQRRLPRKVAKTKAKENRGFACLVVAAVPMPHSEDDDMSVDGVEEVPDEPGAEPIELPPPLSKVVIDETLQCSVTKLRKLMLDHDSPVYTKYCEKRQYGDVEVEPWTEVEGKLQRALTYQLPATSFVNSLKAYEKQAYLVNEKGGFVVLNRTQTPDAPSGKSFETVIQHAATRIDDRSCRLRTSIEVNFMERVMLRGTIETFALRGMEQATSTYRELVRAFTSPPKHKAAHRAKSAIDEGAHHFRPGHLPASNKFLTILGLGDAPSILVYRIVLFLLLVSLIVNIQLLRSSGNAGEGSCMAAWP